MRTFAKTLAEVDSYLNLKAGWFPTLSVDSPEAIAPTRKTIEVIKEFLKLLEKENISAPQPMLTSSGEASLYWKLNEDYIEIGFEDHLSYTYLTMTPAKIAGVDDVPVNGKIHPDLLEDLKTFFPKK